METRGLTEKPFVLLLFRGLALSSHARSNSATKSGEKKEFSNRLVECTGPGVDGKGFVIWTKVCVPILITKN